MTYQVKVEKKVLKFLQKHPQVQDSFFHAAMILENTGLSPLLDIKLLQGRKDRWRLRL
ncbi:MAG: hypothetical protein Q4B28_06360 [bacterium]|nr:hypothetical protein [bacterium]